MNSLEIVPPQTFLIKLAAIKISMLVVEAGTSLSNLKEDSVDILSFFEFFLIIDGEKEAHSIKIFSVFHYNPYIFP